MGSRASDVSQGPIQPARSLNLLYIAQHFCIKKSLIIHKKMQKSTVCVENSHKFRTCSNSSQLSTQFERACLQSAFDIWV